MRGYSDRTLKRAKSLRRDLTDAERKLWSILRNRQLDGAKFRRQQPIGPYIADFVCQERRLIVEADGGQHSESLSDARRTAFLEAGVRFWNNDILNNLDGVAEVIAKALQPLTPLRLCLSRPLPQGERE